MYTITEIVDEYSGNQAIRLTIETDATAEDIEKARSELPEPVRHSLRPTNQLLFILNALKKIENGRFTATLEM